MTSKTALALSAALALSPTTAAAEKDDRTADQSQQIVRTQNKQIVRTLYDECLNQGRLDRLKALVADDYVGASGERGPAGFASTITALRDAFPDIHFTLEDLVAEHDRVVVRWTWKGTHQRSFRDLAPTHKVLLNTGIAIYQLKDRQLTRSWLQTDRLGLLQQIGTIPTK